MSIALSGGGPVRRAKSALYGWVSRRYMAGCSNYNPLDVRRGSRSKRQARDMFAARGLPHAKGLVFTDPRAALRFGDEHGYPLVVKPNVGGFSRGSHFPITNRRELLRAAIAVKAWWPTSVVEQYLDGANYRVLATRDEIVSVLRRHPPFVDGDGRSDIAALMVAENAVRESMGLYPVVHPLEPSPAVRAHLKRSGRDLRSVPAAGERVFLYHRVALAPGGTVETVDRTSLPAANRELFLDVVRAFGANLFGVDVIFERGIDEDWRTQKTILLEVNSRPYTAMHGVPRRGKPDDLSAFHARMAALGVADTDTF